jgi:myo-inositol-1(or 4)-monophosphatase
MARDGESPDRDDWLNAFRRACERVGEAVASMSLAERRRPRGRGAGGDITAQVDRVAEDIVLDELRALGRTLRVLSEEVGAVAIGDPGAGAPLVVIDPIDGSLNATRGLPVFSTSIALATGPVMGDVGIGMVRDHGTGELWVAERGRGAWLDGVRLEPAPPPDSGPLPLPIVLLEGASPARISRAATRLTGRAGRLRALGSLALSLCHTAAGRGDAMAGLARGRAVDVAAAQLVAREAGLLVGMPGVDDLPGIALDMKERFGVTAAHDAATIDLLRGLPRG